MDLPIELFILIVALLNKSNSTWSTSRMKEGVKKQRSELKVGCALGWHWEGSARSVRGEKSTCMDAVELELDFLRRNMLSDRSLGKSASPLLLGSSII